VGLRIHRSTIRRPASVQTVEAATRQSFITSQAAMKEIGNADRQEVGLGLNNRTKFASAVDQHYS